MPAQNTVARNILTEKDEDVIQICKIISEIVIDNISNDELKKEFKKKFGKISFSRDGGLGLGSGKLQRDALCTRGRQGKAPFSNRNLRWHPLVLAVNCPSNFTKMNLTVDDKSKKLIFIPSDNPDIEIYPEEVHGLEKPYCVPASEWLKHDEILKGWTKDEWILNWCMIPILEYCPANYAIESYGVLSLAISATLYKTDLRDLYDLITRFLKTEIKLSEYYPTRELVDNLILCPLCNTRIDEYPAGLPERVRPHKWTPSWQANKRGEGKDKSIQIMHVNPLNELEVNHNAMNVRFGHRWCNVAMTDHSIIETITFMKEIIQRH